MRSFTRYWHTDIVLTGSLMSSFEQRVVPSEMEDVVGRQHVNLLKTLRAGQAI